MMKQSLCTLIKTGSLGGPVSLFTLAAAICLLSFTAYAQVGKDKVLVDSILGIGIGSNLNDAHARLDPLGINGGRDTKERGRKEVWTFKETDFASLALKTNKQGSVVWVSGFLRPGREIDFAKFGEVSRATLSNESEAVWNIETPAGGYRLVVKGGGQKARVIYMLSLALPPIE